MVLTFRYATSVLRSVQTIHKMCKNIQFEKSEYKRKKE